MLLWCLLTVFFNIMKNIASFIRIFTVPSGFALSVLALFSSTPTHAQSNFKIALDEKAVWDSNPLMLTSGERDIWGSESKLTVGYDRQTKKGGIDLSLAAARNIFNDGAFNSTDAFWNAGLIKRTTRWEGSLDTSLAYDTTRTNELTAFGRNIDTERRLHWEVAPALSYTVTPRTTLALNGKWNERRYRGNTFRTDYRTTSLAPSVAYRITPLQTAFLSFQAQRYETTSGNDQTVDSLGPSLGWKYNFLPEFTAGLSMGYWGSKYKGYGLTNNDWEYNPVYGATLSYLGQRNQTEFAVEQMRQPYANGTESEIFSVKVKNKFAITPQWTLNMHAVYQDADQPPVSSTNLDSAYEESVSVTYKVFDRWHVSLSQKYRRENLENSLGEAERNIVKAALTYRLGGDPRR